MARSPPGRGLPATAGRITRVLVAAVAAAAGAGSAHAQEMWLMPQVLLAAAPPTQPVAVSLYTGRDFVAAAEVPMDLDRVVSFTHVYEGGREHLLPEATEGARPLGSLRSLAPGEHLAVVDYREPAGGEPGARGRRRDRYFLKALVYVAPRRDAVFRQEMGQTLEVVPLVDPTIVLGGPLPVRVWFRGAPLAGARVVLLSRMGARIARATATTGSDGTASIVVPAEGTQLLQVVHVVRCADCADAEWDGYHAAYTFANGPLVVTGTVTAPWMFAPEVERPGEETPARPDLTPPGAERPSEAAPTAPPPPAAPGGEPLTGPFLGPAVGPPPGVGAVAPAPPGQSATWPVVTAVLASAAAAALGLFLRRHGLS